MRQGGIAVFGLLGILYFMFWLENAGWDRVLYVLPQFIPIILVFFIAVIILTQVLFDGDDKKWGVPFVIAFATVVATNRFVKQLTTEPELTWTHTLYWLGIFVGITVVVSLALALVVALVRGEIKPSLKGALTILGFIGFVHAIVNGIFGFW